MREILPLIALLICAPALSEATLFIQASSLNLRAEGAADAETVAKLPINTELHKLSTDGEFTKVRVLAPEFFRGLEGWVASKFVGASALVLSELLQSAKSAETPEASLNFWQRAWALDGGSPSTGAGLVAAYEAAGRHKAARWWKKKVAAAVRAKKRPKSPIDHLHLNYFEGQGQGQLRNDVQGARCSKLESCALHWSGAAGDLRPQPLTCRDTASDSTKLTGSKIVRQWIAAAAKGASLRPGDVEIKRAAALDLDGDGNAEQVRVVDVTTVEVTDGEYPYGPPTCTRSVAHIDGIWVPLTKTSCASDVETEALIGAFRVRGVSGVFLLFSYAEEGASGSSLWLWSGGESKAIGKPCAGNG